MMCYGMETLYWNEKESKGARRFVGISQIYSDKKASINVQSVIDASRTCRTAKCKGAALAEAYIH